MNNNKICQTQFLSAIESVAHNFVLPGIRDRFVHEAVKKPQQLMYRVCHSIETVFQKRYANKSLGIDDRRGRVFVFDLAGDVSEHKISDVEDLLERRSQGGILIVETEGRFFYAAPELGSVSVSYAGDSTQSPHVFYSENSGTRRPK